MALLFLIPGSGSTIRLNGRAVISAEPALLERFAEGRDNGEHFGDFLVRRGLLDDTPVALTSF
jgi:sulfite reductase beta subunit-like hemoprotein